MGTPSHSQARSSEPVETLLRTYADTAKQIATNDWNTVRMKKWHQDVGGLEPSDLIDLGIVLDVDGDPKARSTWEMRERRKVVREVVTSLIHRNNSDHLETVITKLADSTKRLDRTMTALTFVGVFLAAMQVVSDWEKLSYEHLFLMFLVFGLGMALIIPFVLLMRQDRVTRPQGS
jgi:hypothetical protein